jgi:hypothetical protein
MRATGRLISNITTPATTPTIEQGAAKAVL